MNTRKLVCESLKEFAANNMNPIEKFSIQNDSDFKEMQEYLTGELGIDPIPELKNILGDDIYFIGHGENDVTPGTAERIDAVYELIGFNRHTNQVSIDSTLDDMESFDLFVHDVNGLTLVDLSDGYTSGWFTNAKGMKRILDLTNQS